MQMLYVCDCTSGEYVSDKRWLQASPPDCPWCKPKGRCSLVRHGFYARLQPQGTLVRRFRCKASGRTVSMLPDCLASHWPGDLDTMEEAARQAEGKSKYKAAQEREWAGMAHPPDQPGPPDTGLYRWLSRRVLAVVLFLELVRSLYPDRFGALQPTVSGFRRHLGRQRVLVALRGVAGDQLRQIRTPIGLRPEQNTAHRGSETAHTLDDMARPPPGPGC